MINTIAKYILSISNPKIELTKKEQTSLINFFNDGYSGQQQGDIVTDKTPTIEPKNVDTNMPVITDTLPEQTTDSKFT